jgi:hypothetical protein
LKEENVQGLTFKKADEYMHSKGFKLLKSDSTNNRVVYVKGHRRVDLIFLLYPKHGYLCARIEKRHTRKKYK